MKASDYFTPAIMASVGAAPIPVSRVETIRRQAELLPGGCRLYRLPMADKAPEPRGKRRRKPAYRSSGETSTCPRT